VSNKTDPLAELGRRLDDLALKEGCRRWSPIGPLTTYRVGGPAALFIKPYDIYELTRVARVLEGFSGELPVMVLGRGSNLLVADSGFLGLAIQLGVGFADIDTEGTRMTAGGATRLPVLARRSVLDGLSGFEWGVGIPGSVGGAIRMNAGGHGADIADSLVWADVFDLSAGLLNRRLVSELGLGYRTSLVTSEEVVVSGCFDLSPGNRVVGESLLAEIVQWRRENQPGGTNAGSVFTNPQTHTAGSLIESAGAKGLRFGTAEVSSKHANFIQSDSGGKADDVLALMVRVQELVFSTHGIELEFETVLLGF